MESSREAVSVDPDRPASVTAAAGIHSCLHAETNVTLEYLQRKYVVGVLEGVRIENICFAVSEPFRGNTPDGDFSLVTTQSFEV